MDATDLEPGSVVRLKYRRQGRPTTKSSLPGAESCMEFFAPLVFEGKITGEADKWVFRSEAGWRVTFTEPQLSDYRVEV